jgi:hypothetical protein
MFISIEYCVVHKKAKLTSQTNPRSAIERQVSPFRIRLVVVERHVLVPALWSKQLSVHTIEIRTSMHSIHAISYCGAFGDEDGRLSVRPTTCWENGCRQSCAGVYWYRGIKSEG